MDKKEKKLAEEAMKNALMPGMTGNQAAFLDAANLLGKFSVLGQVAAEFNWLENCRTAYWGNGRDTGAASMPFSPFASGLGMMPGSSAYDKNASAAQQASNNMNASEFSCITDESKLLNFSSDWYAMAQMAAQDYFSRLQMSGMVHPDMANFSSLGALNSFHNNSSMAGGSSNNNKNNLKRKDKGANQDDYSSKASNSKEVKFLPKGRTKKFTVILHILAFKIVKCQSVHA